MLNICLFVQEEVFPLRNKYEDSDDDDDDDEDGGQNEEVEDQSDDNDDDDDENSKHISDSDIEGAESGLDELPNDKAWGKLRRSFYNTDYLDKDHGGNIYNN